MEWTIKRALGLREGERETWGGVGGGVARR